MISETNDKKEKIVVWINKSFKNWLKKYELKIEIISDDLNDFRISIKTTEKQLEFKLSSDELDEIYLSITEKLHNNVQNKYNINSVFAISKKQFLTFITSEDETNLEPLKTKMYLDKKKEKIVKLEITNKLTYTLLYILVENNCHINFNEKMFDKAVYITQLFDIIYTNFDLNFETSEDTVIEIIISSIFEINQILKANLIPVGITPIIDMVDIDVLQDTLTLKKIDEEMEREISGEHHLFSYDIEALAYFFAAHKNEDNRSLL